MADETTSKDQPKPPESKPAAEKPAAPPAAKAAAAPSAKPAGPTPQPWESEMVAKFKARFGSGIREASTYVGQNYMVVDGSIVYEALQLLREDEGFDYCVDITAVHYPKREEQFDLVWGRRAWRPQCPPAQRRRCTPHDEAPARAGSRRPRNPRQSARPGASASRCPQLGGGSFNNNQYKPSCFTASVNCTKSTGFRI